MTSPIFKVETVEHLNFLGHGLIANSILYCGIEIGLFDALDGGPKTTQQLEKDLNLETRAARALLSPLAALGLVERDEGVWKNSAVSATTSGGLPMENPFKTVLRIIKKRRPIPRFPIPSARTLKKEALSL